MRTLEPEERGIFKEIKRALLLLLLFFLLRPIVSAIKELVFRSVSPVFNSHFLLSSCSIGMLLSSGSLQVILS